MAPPLKFPASPASRAKLVLMVSAGMLIFGGLMLTLWGWDDWRGFFAHPARCAVVALMFFRFAPAIFSAHPNIFGRGRDDKRVRERGFWPLLYAGALVVMASPYFDARSLWVLPGGDATRYTGLVLFVAGFALSLWAQAHLGRFFSGHITLQDGHRLITDGPFTYIRHPRYAGLILLFLGLALVFRSTTGAGAGVVCAILFLTRIPHEEALLAREFGEVWTAYARRTKRLLPGTGAADEVSAQDETHSGRGEGERPPKLLFAENDTNIRRFGVITRIFSVPSIGLVLRWRRRHPASSMKPTAESETVRFPDAFVTTHWSVVLKAGNGASPLALAALEQLCRDYWFPLYVYVRRQGFMPPEAQDVTQGFFHQLIEKGFLKDVDPNKGKFRSFLLAAIKHYILNARKHAGRLKRGGNQVMVPFDADQAETRFRAEPATASTAERAFDRRWAMTVMELGLQRLAEEYREAGKEQLFQALKKFISAEAKVGDYSELAPGLGLTRNAVGVGVHRLRQRYGELIRAEIANTVAQPLEIEDEMRYLLGLLTER